MTQDASDARQVELGHIEVLFVRCQPRLRARLFRAMRGMTDAEADNIIQEAFLHLHLSLSRGVEIRNPAAWLWKACEHAALKARHPGPARDTAGLQQDYPDSRQRRPLSVLVQAEQLAVSVEALDSLSDRDRRILEMRELEGAPFSAIARTLDLTEQAARKGYQRARHRVREWRSRYSSSFVEKADSNTYRPRSRESAIDAIHTLPAELAELLEARYVRTASLQEIATSRGVTAAQVAERLAHAEELFARKYGIPMPDRLVELLRRGP